MPLIKRLAEHFRHAAHGELPSHIAEAVEREGSYKGRNWHGRMVLFEKSQNMRPAGIVRYEYLKTPSGASAKRMFETYIKVGDKYYKHSKVQRLANSK